MKTNKESERQLFARKMKEREERRGLPKRGAFGRVITKRRGRK